MCLRIDGNFFGVMIIEAKLIFKYNDGKERCNKFVLRVVGWGKEENEKFGVGPIIYSV